MNRQKDKKENRKAPSLFSVIRPYGWFVAGIIVLTVASSALSLVVPKLVAAAIDAYGRGGFDFRVLAIEFSLVAVFVFIFTYLQGVVQTYVSELVARDLRTRLIEKIAVQNYSFVESVTAAKLLTNLSSDVDAVKFPRS